ncbi:MAG TPA: glycoside hydrolase family 15 protein [Acidimicrobiales bacterium]|nr:glycoside hydrolase family 15 protein [Acidimicrobiales bacterium]
MNPAKRINGQARIEEYAVVTDGRTCALSAIDGRIDWWAVPTLDAQPVCGALLDPERGGYLSVAPTEEFEVERRYLEGTNVLESTYRTATGSATVTHAFNMGSSGRLPWTELAFRIEGVSGEVEFKWEFLPGTQLREVLPRIENEYGVPIIRLGTQTIAVLSESPETVTMSETAIYATVNITSETTMVLSLVASEGEPLFLPTLEAVGKRLDATVHQWRVWSGQLSANTAWYEAVLRSALVLKTLFAEWTGAIAAAATTSLPEDIGGEKNWDYRYSWVRDSAFTIDAFMNLQLTEEVHSSLAWLLKAVTRNGPELHVLYTLEGNLPNVEEEMRVPGYRDSRPVRSGNGAANQLQLGNFGDVFDAVFRFVSNGHVLDETTCDLLFDLAQQCTESWRRADSGMWELKRVEHYTISKIGCWVALDRAIRLAEHGYLNGDLLSKWRDERAEIRAFIEERCWSQMKNAYTFYADSEDLDASVLLSARTGFDTGERLASTIAAIDRELRRGPLIFRYTNAERSEGAFIACTFWMVQALAINGQRPAAAALMEEAIALANDVGIFAEQMDVKTHAFLGNVPQALSHLALINAAYCLR